MAQAANFAGVSHDYTEEIDKDHGRLEVRRYWISETLCTLPDTERWAGLRSIGMVERSCHTGDLQTTERRYFINTLAADAKRFAHAVRGHWGVENRLHWRLDLVCNEDASCIRKGNAAAIMTSLRHLCINLFEQDPSPMGPAKKRRKAGWNDAYRAKVLFVRQFMRARPATSPWRLPRASRRCYCPPRSSRPCRPCGWISYPLSPPHPLQERVDSVQAGEDYLAGRSADTVIEMPDGTEIFETSGPWEDFIDTRPRPATPDRDRPRLALPRPRDHDARGLRDSERSASGRRERASERA